LGVASGQTEPSPSPVPWQRGEIDPLTKKYEIRFYLENTGFIASIEEGKDLNITWFPFSPELEKEKEIAPAENLPDEQINFFLLPWKDLYREDVELMISEIKDQHLFLLEEAEKAKVSN